MAYGCWTATAKYPFHVAWICGNCGKVNVEVVHMQAYVKTKPGHPEDLSSQGLEEEALRQAKKKAEEFIGEINRGSLGYWDRSLLNGKCSCGTCQPWDFHEERLRIRRELKKQPEFERLRGKSEGLTIWAIAAFCACSLISFVTGAYWLILVGMALAVLCFRGASAKNKQANDISARIELANRAETRQMTADIDAALLPRAWDNRIQILLDETDPRLIAIRKCKLEQITSYTDWEEIDPTYDDD